MIREIQVGDRVQYAAKFLKSIGVCTGPICFAVGVVTEIKRYVGLTIAIVDWCGGDLPHVVAVQNLVPVDQKHLEPV